MSAIAFRTVLSLLAITSLLSACGARVSRGGGGGGGDDDDATADDDTSAGDDDTSSGDDDTSSGDDDTSSGDDDTSSGDDDTTPDDNLVASGNYYLEYDWGADLEEATGWTDCFATWDITPVPEAPETGCPGCFAVFRTDMEFDVHTCGDALDTVNDLFGVNFGISGNVMWIYDYGISDCRTWMTGSSTSSSFVGQAAWVPQDVSGYDYETRETIEVEWF
jgi:hypothetical protein